MKTDDIAPFVRYIRYLDVNPSSEFNTSFAYDMRMFYAVNGKGMIDADGRNYVIDAFGALIIPPGIPYRILPCTDGAVKYIAVNFDITNKFSHLDRPIPPATTNFDKKSVLANEKFDDKKELNGVMHIKNIPGIERYLVKAEYEYSHKLVCYRAKVNAYFSQCIADCIRLSVFGGFLSQNANYETEKILNYIHGHYSENLTNKKLGEIFSFHPNYINHLIKTCTGLSLHQYIIRIRIINSARLLEEGGTTVSEAAQISGFCDTSTFSKHFKKIMGIPPVKYKNKPV